MRVAVTIPPDHPHAGGEATEPVTFAYKLGRIREGEDNLIIHTGEIIPLDEFVAGFISQAKREYPEEGVHIRPQRLIDNGDGTSAWIDADQFDPEVHTPQGAGGSKAAEFHVVAGQEAPE